MKIWATSFHILAVLLAAGLLASCQPPSLRDVIFEDQSTQLQTRSIQSRTFEMTDQIKAMRTVITTLQDLDFVLNRADSRLGVITATKLQTYQLYITVKVDELKGERMRVRIQLRAGIYPLVEGVYQEFFTSLEKNLFLTAHHITVPKSFAPEVPPWLTEKAVPPKNEKVDASRSAAISAVQVDKNEPWTGTWKVTGSQWGDTIFKLNQSGGSVKSIQGSWLKLKGKVNGNRLYGRYTEVPEGTRIELILSQDGMSFKGKESHLGRTNRLKGVKQ